MSSRKLIPDDQVIVVLDTSVARRIAHGEASGWLDAFAAMAQEGYSFSLSDIAVGELLIWLRSGRSSPEQHEQLVEGLQRFLSSSFPLLPGGIDVQAMIGAVENPLLQEEVEYLAEAAWRQICDPSLTVVALGPGLEQIRDEMVVDWAGSLKRVSMHARCGGIDLAGSNPIDVAELLAEFAGSALDEGSDLDPPKSVRMHLEARYRFWQSARTSLRKEPYNPQNKKRENDAIDVDLLCYLQLPAFVVCADMAFIQSLTNLKSFQNEWMMTPSVLADQWRAGARPHPSWPENEGEAGTEVVKPASRGVSEDVLTSHASAE